MSEQDYEDALWSNDFYSAPLALTALLLSNHIQTLKKNVNIPNSFSTQLVSSYLTPQTLDQEQPHDPHTRKTSLMRASPSMKALEKALNADLPPKVPVSIPEEDESMVSYGTATHGQYSALAPVLQALPPQASPEANASGSRPRSNDKYARNKHVSQHPSPPNSRSMLLPLPESTSQKPPANNRPLDQPRITHSASLPFLDSRSISLEQENLPPVIPPKDKAKQPSQQKVRSMLDSLPQHDGPSKKNAAPLQELSRASDSYVGSTPKPKPHQSTRTHVLPQVEASPQQPRRSATLGDIANISKNDKTTKQSNKRFSFRGLFKIKSKNHSLSTLIDEQQPISEKPVTKSLSIPDLALYGNSNSKLPEVPTKESEVPSRPSPAPQNSSSGVATQQKARQQTQQTQLSDESELEPDESEQSEPPLAQFKPKTSSPPITLNAAYKYPKASATRAISSTSDHEEHSDNEPEMEKAPSLHLMEAPQITANTIREVDDSDYNPQRASDSENERIHDVRNLPLWTLSDHMTPQQPQAEFYRLSQGSRGESNFGSPFVVSFGENTDTPKQAYSSLRPDTESSSPVSHDDLAVKELEDFDFQSLPRVKITSEQLVGGALFPKSLDAHEVESIVSMERSRSMKSIRSNKRSSFLGYSGSDENIILGSDVLAVRQRSVKRSGSILKNSLSSHSLHGELIHLIDTAFDTMTTSQVTEDHALPSRDSLEENYSELIEFSEYIDFDNLDFTSSPLPQQSPRMSTPSIVVDGGLGNTPQLGPEALDKPSSPLEYEVEQEDSTADHSKQEASLDKTHEHSGSERDEESVFSSAYEAPDYTQHNEVMQDPALEANHEFTGHREYPATPSSNGPQVIVITSESSLERDARSAIPESENEGIPLSSPSFDHYPDLPNDAQFDDTPYYEPFDQPQSSVPFRAHPTTPRPVSMSFKGFNGSAFKDKVLRQSGSHQLMQFDYESFNETSAVGQGFGSSEEDDEDDEDSDDEFDYLHGNPMKGPEVDRNAVEARRQQHLKEVLDLQPPPQNRPFHHDRIPSISDQSASLSPRLLSSFITRIRKPAPSLPRLEPPRPVVKFLSRIVLYDTYHHDEYDRHPEIATCNQLTPALAQQIKEELNELKANMEVHEESICYTQFF